MNTTQGPACNPFKPFKQCVVLLLLNICTLTTIFVLYGVFHAQGHTQLFQYMEKRDAVDRNLREMVKNLQARIVSLPKLFTSRQREQIVAAIKQQYTALPSVRFVGHAQYASLFSREEKRDLASGKIVVSQDGTNLFVAYGLFDQFGNFSQSIERFAIHTDQVADTQQHLEQLIQSHFQANSLDSVEYEKKINLLKKISTDSAFEAEKTRMAFLGEENNVVAVAATLLQGMQERHQQFLAIALGLSVCDLLLSWFWLGRLWREKQQQPGQRPIFSGKAGLEGM